MKSGLIVLSSLLLSTCGSKSRPVTLTTSKLKSKQLAQIEAYCACSDNSCKNAATVELRRLSSALIDELVKETKKSDFDSSATLSDFEILLQISDRALECEIPREELMVEIPKELMAIAKAQMAAYREKSRKNAEAILDAKRVEREEACDGGDGKECYLLASMSQNAAEPDSEKISAQLQHSCELGHGRGCRVLAQGYQDEPETIKLAFSYFASGCEKGDSQSCTALSVAYTVGIKKSGHFSMGGKGLGVEKNETKAQFFEDEAKRHAVRNAEESGIRGILSTEPFDEFEVRSED